MIDAARCMEPVNAILERDRDRAQILVVRCVLHDPDVAFGWGWLYGRSIGKLVAEIDVDTTDRVFVDIVRDAAAFIGAAYINDLAGAHLVWCQVDLQRRAEIVYALAEVLAKGIRIKAAP